MKKIYYFKSYIFSLYLKKRIIFIKFNLIPDLCTFKNITIKNKDIIKI